MAQIILTFGLGKEKIKVVRSIAQKNRIQIKEILSKKIIIRNLVPRRDSGIC